MSRIIDSDDEGAGASILGRAGRWEKPARDLGSSTVVDGEELQSSGHIPAADAEREERAAVVGRRSGKEGAHNRRLLWSYSILSPTEYIGSLSYEGAGKGRNVRTASDADLDNVKSAPAAMVQRRSDRGGSTSTDATTEQSQRDAIAAARRIVASATAPMFDVRDDVQLLEELEQGGARDIDDDEPRSGEDHEYRESDGGSGDSGCSCGEINLLFADGGMLVDPSCRFTVVRTVRGFILERIEPDLEEGEDTEPKGPVGNPTPRKLVQSKLGRAAHRAQLEEF